MVTSEEVARLAGVSRATVSRALNGSTRVSKEVRERVHAAIATLGYEPDLVAQSLVRQRSHVIALSLFPDDNGLTISRLGETEITSTFAYRTGFARSRRCFPTRF